MVRCLILCALLVSLTMFGCSPSEEKQPTQAEKKSATEKVTEAAKAVSAEVKEKAAAATEKAGEMATEAKEAAKEAADVVEEKAQTAAVATTMAADKAVEAAKKAVSPETIVLEASFGNVTFPHAQHQARYECAICHGEGTPGKFGINKDKAHALCRECHKSKGAGPTACTGCHKK